MGGGRKHEAKRRSEKREVCVKRRVEENVFTPLCTVNHREKGALLMVCAGPRRRQAEMEEMIAEMLFLLRGCWDLIRGNGREVRKAASVCLSAPN